MKLLLLTFTIASFIQTSIAQIILQREDLPMAGYKYYEAFQNKNLSGITPGEDGANKLWDYSKLTTDGLDTSIFQSPSAYASFASFTGSNIAQEFRNGYEFYNFNGNYAAMTGFAQYANQEYLKFELNDLPLFKFPTSISENNSFSNTRVSTYKTKNNSTTTFVDSDSLNYKLTYIQSLEIKGWGNIETPYANEEVIKTKATAKVLLNLSHRNKTTGVWTLSTVTQEFLESNYYFYAKGKGLPLLTITYKDSTDKTLSSISWYTGQDPIRPSAYESLLDDDQYTISPNPGNGLFMLNIPVGNLSKIDVLDVLGKEVESSSSIDNGRLEIFAPNGIYQVNLYTSKGIVTKRVIVQK